MSNKLKDLLAQVNGAAKELLGTIRKLDAQIDELQEKRQRIGAAGVSKADFLGYIETTLEKNAGHIGALIAQELNKVDRSFFSLENSSLYIPFLTGSRGIPVVITDGAAFWYLKPAILSRMEELAAGMDFPADAVPVEDRRRMIAAIDTEIERLRTERDELASQMEAAGIVG